MAVFPAVLDSCVLYGIGDTDLFMSLSAVALYRPHWSAEILDGARRNILRDLPDLDPAALDRRFAAMNTFDPAALAEPPPALVSAMNNDNGDRHVLALAVHVGAPVVVTYNLQHFLPQHCEPYGVEAQHPDVFLEHLIDLSSHTVREVIRGIASRNRRPPDTPQAVVNVFASRYPVAMSKLVESEGAPTSW